MQITLAFDIYGTLIDPHGLVSQLQGLVGDKARAFSSTWREKQLEYSFRRGLMHDYKDFSVCTRDALDYSCLCHQTILSHEQKQTLLRAYRTLPAFNDVADSLSGLKTSGFRLYAFSNGSHDAVETLLINAGIMDFFHGIVSVDELQSFKPDPAVYKHFLNKSGASSRDAWLISSNPFDVIGAVSAGMHSAWLQRSKTAVFDPWGIEPTITLENLADLKQRITASRSDT